MASTSLRIGDTVSVPGQMHGTLKFIGPVNGKRGVFAGVQLAPEFATRGKNSGDVEGKHYFRTSVPGSGIFLPVDKAEKRHSGGSTSSTPGSLSSFNQGGRTPSGILPKPNFSQSVGPGSMAARTASPTALKPNVRRESLPRPSSPLRKVNNAPTASTPAAARLTTPRTRPSLGFNRSAIGAPGTNGVGAKSPAVRQPSKFGHSLRQSSRAQESATPNRMRQPTSSAASTTTTTTDDYSLGPESSFDESPQQGSGDEVAEHTPTPAAGRSLKPKLNAKKHDDEARHLRQELEHRDRQLNEQASSIAEMEKSLIDLQNIMESMQLDQDRNMPEDEESMPKDVQDLRASLREKNDRIKAMTAEFDNNRADFRSTIDTLEMASTETERVYERRIEELLEEVKHLQERHEDVEGVAQQFRQLEDLVAELEEGLEDARRGEAEARGEVEFLRGEVERGRSELRRERERNRAGDKLNGIDPDGGGASVEEAEELQLKMNQKDDEIRGLKVIIQNLNNSSMSSPDRAEARFSQLNGSAYTQGHAKTKSTTTVISVGAGEDTSTHLLDQIRDLEVLLQKKSTREEELREEVTKLRQSVQFGPKFVVPGLEGKHSRNVSGTGKHRSIQSSSTITAGRSSGSSFTHGHDKKGAVEFVDAEQFPANTSLETPDRRRGKDAQQDEKNEDSERTPDAASVSAGTETSSNAMWCELCEEPGHDILTCTQMIDGGTSTQNTDDLDTPRPPQREFGLGLNTNGSNKKDGIARDVFRRSHESHGPPPETSAPPAPTGPTTIRNSGQTLNHKNTTNRGSLSDVARPAPLLMSRNSSTSNQNLTLNTPRSSITATTPAATTPKSSSPRKKRDSLTANTTTSPTKTTAPADTSNPDATTTNTTSSNRNSSKLTDQPPTLVATSHPARLIEGTGDQAGMLAGKESGVIDPDRWCALCERDGHESVDCPIESAF